MTKQELNNLIDQVNNGAASEEELRLYTTYLNQITSGEETWDIEALGEEEVVKAELLRRIETLKIKGKAKKVVLWPRIVAVAAAVALIVLGVYFFKGESGILKQVQDDVVVNDIAPGKNGATLTLANGKVIQLSDAKSGVVIGDDKLAYNDGSAVGSLSASGGEMPEGQRGGSVGAKDMTASTTKGQTYIFTLPDGTKVWLNAASSLTIPSGFSGTESRIVELSGEAYFEVATSYTSLRGRRTKQSFVVKTAGNNGRPGQEVTVLGTHFNINSYADEGNIKTTLLEGSVRVTKTNPPKVPLLAKDASILLKPNQQSVLSGNKLDVIGANVEQTMAWKNGQFAFNKQSLEEIMRSLARWYDVEVVFEPGFKSVPFTGSVSRFRNLSTILKILELTGKVKFITEGRRVTVMN